MGKKALTNQVLVLIFMMILMMGIIIFGISKLNDVSNTISEQEQLEIQDKIKSLAQYCENPLNKGSQTREEISSNKFNGICIVQKQTPQYLDEIPEDQQLQIEEIASSGDNIIMFNVKTLNNDKPQSIQIVDSFSSYANRSECWYGEETIEVKMTC